MRYEKQGVPKIKSESRIHTTSVTYLLWLDMHTHTFSNTLLTAKRYRYRKLRLECKFRNQISESQATLSSKFISVNTKAK